MNKTKSAILMFTAILSVSAFSANLGDTADNLSTQVKAITNLMVYGGTLLGMAFLVVGGLNLKKHGDNPQQVPLSKPLIFLAAGSLLFGLGSTSDVMQETLFGSGRASEGDAGTFNDFTTS
ncbi:Type IV secretion protein IcmD [Vibrio crassostreae]|nr:Type IV secretion protein IcmD [Vibrio crassostreae]